MKKGIGPRGLGAPKSAAKMYGKSPAKQSKPTKPKKLPTGVAEPALETRQMGPLDKYNPHKPGTSESKKYIKDYQTQYYEGIAGKEKAGIKPTGVSKTRKRNPNAKMPDRF